MVVDKYLNSDLAAVPAMKLLTEMCDFMNLNENEAATDELIVSEILHLRYSSETYPDSDFVFSFLKILLILLRTS